ncbi:MAG: transposase [Polyangiaceae bacterium]|nr:transposase [Polyangiaceae bacterium]
MKSAEHRRHDETRTVCKTILEERGQRSLGQRERYHFYVTNDFTMSAEDVVREANDRCNQENVLAQLKSGVRALRAPLNTLNANWAYMVIASIAWSLKAWFALMLPISPRWRAQHEAERERVLRMEFRVLRQPPDPRACADPSHGPDAGLPAARLASRSPPFSSAFSTPSERAACSRTSARAARPRRSSRRTKRGRHGLGHHERDEAGASMGRCATCRSTSADAISSAAIA